MNEIRIRERTFLFGVALISFVIFYLLLVDRCESEKNVNYSRFYAVDQSKVAADALAAMRGKSQSNKPLPFMVYAVTPTYARPVQKAELTRYKL